MFNLIITAMTICLKNSAEMAKFFARCMYEKTSMRDYAKANFSRIESLMMFDQVTVATDLSKKQVEDLLTSNRVKFNWVSEF